MLENDKDRFNFAFNEVIKHEGGFCNNKNDPGGPTNYGVSLHFLNEMGIDINHDGLIDINDVRQIHSPVAANIYKKYFWDKYHYEAINSLAVATKIFDMSVNMGPLQAHKIVQEACNHNGYQLVNDGILGPKTFAALNEITAHNREEDLMNDIVDGQKWFYDHLVEDHPKLQVFLKGWMNRATYIPSPPT